MIAVTVNGLPSAPTVSSPVSYCQNATATALTATGTALQWYTLASGGTGSATAPTPVTTTAGTTDNYVSQTLNGCESPRSIIAVTVNALPAAPLVSSPVAYCQNATATALTATGTALKWYTGSTGGTGSTTAPTPSTTTIGTTNYYVSQTTNTCEGAKATIAVTINSAATASISAGGSTTFCQGGSVTLTANSGSSYIWFNGASQVGSNSTYTATTSGSYTVQITNPSGCSGQVTSGATTVTVNPLPAAPAVNSTVSYCQNATAAALTASGTALKWYNIATGGTELGFAPTPGTSLAGTTDYYVSQTTNGCEGARSAIAVTVNASPQATITPSGPTTFVEGGSVVLQANTGSGFTYEWFKGNTQVGTGVSYAATESGTYTVQVTNTSTCKATSQATNVNVTTNQPSVITITSPSSNTTVVGAITITVNVTDTDGSVTLVEFLDGTTVIGTSSTAPYTYLWDNPSAGDHVITVRVTESNGGVTTSSPTNITSGTTGILSSLVSINGVVYPNPSNGEVTVEAEIDLSDASISVVDILGKEVAHTSSATGNGAKVDLSGVSDGMYIIIIKQGNSMLRKKITVKR
jgi:oligosaccharide reducing-end xylanase